MNLVEIIAVVFSLISVILTIKNNILCWYTGIIGIIFYSIIFYQNHLLSNMWLQGLFIIQSIFGIVNWNKPIKYPIKWVGKQNRIIVFSITSLICIIIYIITKSFGGNMPYLDSITTSLSIMAMVLMAYRKIDSWILWILVDIIFIWFFYTNGLFLSSFIYFIFLLLSISGLLQWKTDMTTKERIEL